MGRPHREAEDDDADAHARGLEPLRPGYGFSVDGPTPNHGDDELNALKQRLGGVVEQRETHVAEAVREGHGHGAHDVFGDAPGEYAPVGHPSFESSDYRVERELGEAQEPRELEPAQEDVLVKEGADGMKSKNDDTQVDELLTVSGGVVGRGDPLQQTHEPHPRLECEMKEKLFRFLLWHDEEKRDATEPNQPRSDT